MPARCKIFRLISLAFFLFSGFVNAFSQVGMIDTLEMTNVRTKKYNSFYDTLKSIAGHKKFTKALHNAIFPPSARVYEKEDTIRNMGGFEGKTIGKINIIRLDVFGPSLRDTSRKATLWYEKAGNFVHTRSDLHNLRKNLLFKKGDALVTSEIYENERILRALPYIRDVRFYAEPDSLDPNKVNLTLLTQDRFSIGVTGVVNGWNSAAVEFYNRNIFGIGHELSARFVGHLTKEPLMGIETFYKINNIGGRFISFVSGYMNTYLSEGAMIQIDKPFLRISDNWGYGLSGYYFDRSSELPGDIRQHKSVIFGYHQWGGWAGRNLQLGAAKHISQLTFSSQYIHRAFSDRPKPLPNGEQFYQNSNLYLIGITWSKRTFITDELIYGYGITEDIPKGFKNEWVAGYDDNEFGKRYYTHLLMSNANLFPHSPDYFYMEGGFSSFFRSGEIEQAMVEFSASYISRLFPSDNARFRQFIKINYRQGIHRYQNEKLFFEKNNLIRGFESDEVSGVRRLSIDAETVYFQKRDFYRFNIAFFVFADIGVMSPENRPIVKGTYYGGLGLGMRLHNESLVLKTLQVRLSFYPNHPKDVGLMGFLINEHTRQNFYSFQPGPPTPRRFD